MARTINIQNSTLSGAAPNVFVAYEEENMYSNYNKVTDWQIYGIVQEVRNEVEELRLTHGDAVYAAIKEAGFEDKILSLINGTIAQKCDEYQKLLKDNMASFQKEKDQLQKEISELREQIKAGTAQLRLIDTIAKELGYQSQIANKAF